MLVGELMIMAAKSAHPPVWWLSTPPVVTACLDVAIILRKTLYYYFKGLLGQQGFFASFPLSAGLLQWYYNQSWY